MPEFLGKKYTKQDMLRRFGNMSVIGGVRTSTVEGGKANGIRIHDVTSGQLEYTVMESRNLDIWNLKYKGIPLNFLSKCGPVNVGLADRAGMNFLYSVTGGMIYTCGFGNVGGEYADDSGVDHFHGKIRFEPANNVKVTSDWKGDSYIVGVAGESRESGLFRTNIALNREITSVVGENSLRLHDTIENQSFVENPFMLMYHVNCGFPIVDEGSEVYIPSASREAMNDEAKKQFDNWQFTTAPDDTAVESVYLHRLLHDKNGKAVAATWNPTLKLGVMIEFPTDVLCNMIEWRCMASGDYVLGMQPTNCHASGRQLEIDRGTLKHIKPFEKFETEIKLTVLDGTRAFNAFKKKFDACTL